ncbi:MAG TPA: hypothetical protein VF868_14145 [Bacteroidia bacterium]|jgi:hypothetical protein
MRRLIVFSILLAFTITACRKKEGENVVQGSSQIAYSNYGKLAVGNYWIYQRFRIDNLGVSSPLNIYDSCYISKDTIINGKTYFEMYRPDTYGSFYSYLRDSSSCILNSFGKIVFSPTDFSTIFSSGYVTATEADTMAKGIFKMNNKDSLINTPAGAFLTTNFQGVYYMYPAWNHYYTIRSTNTCYSENIGIVVETLKPLFDRGFSEERRLIRYHVN